MHMHMHTHIYTHTHTCSSKPRKVYVRSTTLPPPLSLELQVSMRDVCNTAFSYNLRLWMGVYVCEGGIA